MSEDSNVWELVESAAGYAGNLYNGFDKIVSLMREDKAREAIKTFQEATEGLEWLLQATTALNNSGEGFSAFDTETIKGFFVEMIGAAENMDYVLLADLIEYEVLPIIDEWGNKLDGLLENK